MTNDDGTWVFDSLVGFLQGPIWNAPILTFIEQKSQIFEPNETEGNEDHYKEIHNEYKDLVDTMLGSYMEDIGISSEQFESACTKSSSEGSQIKFHQSLFEQVWAANDYDIFKRMMTQKNVELQLEALEMIQQRYGITPASFVPGGVDDVPTCTQSDEEARILEEVMKKSLEEYEACKAQMDLSTLQIEQSLIESRAEHEWLEAECRREKEILQAVLQQTKESHLASLKGVSDTMLKDKPDNPNETSGNAAQSNIGIDKAELAKRQEYLKSQRDKLLAMKKTEREKQLLAAGETNAIGRPRSARAAQSALKDDRALGPEDNDRTLQVRKALADRLKAEVMGRL